MKYSNLIASELPKHPEYGIPKYHDELLILKRKCLECLDKLEQLKPLLNSMYENAEKRFIAEQQFLKQKDYETLTAKPVVEQTGQKSNEIIEQTNEFKTDFITRIAHSPQETVSFPVSNYPKLDTDPPIVPKRPKFPDMNHQKVAPPIPTKPANAAKLLLGLEEKIDKLRIIHLPERLPTQFLELAAPNTRKKFETCAILCGKFKHDDLFVTHLIVPPQTSTYDSCQMTDEIKLFEYQNARDLLTLGWIHTHPTQSCFMSSVDLHTQCSFQLMLPEAIAIVMAPSKSPSMGIFKLTEPTGMEIVSRCRDPNMFHPHERGDELYEEVPQMMLKLTNEPFELADLR